MIAVLDTNFLVIVLVGKFFFTCLFEKQPNLKIGVGRTNSDD